MGSRWSVVVACALALSTGPGAAWAEVVDSTKPVSASGSIGATASLTVTPKLISNNSSALGLSFGAVTLGASPWKVAPQYLDMAHVSNHNNWAIRVLTNNKANFAGLAGKVLGDAGTTCNLLPTDPNFLTTPACTDDPLGYGGLIGTTPSNPNDRVTLAWQVYKDVVVGGPATPTADDTNGVLDAGVNEVGGYFNAPWAYMADASDCPSTNLVPLNCRQAINPPTIDKTAEFFRVAQGDASNAFLLLHPSDGNRTADGVTPVYIAGRFGGAPADTFSSTIILELYHF